MKLTLLFSGLCCAFSVYSQSTSSEPFSLQEIQQFSQNRIENSMYVNRSSMQKLDSMQNLQYDSWSQLWYSGATTRFQYYPNGSIKTQTSETYQAFKEIMEFGTQGEILSRKYLVWKGSSFEDSFETIYTYHSNGLHESDSSYEYTNGSWQITGYGDYQNDSLGFLKEKTTYQYQGKTALPNSRFYYNNDASGKLINLVTFQYASGVWENNFQYFYTYNTQDRTTEFYYQQWDNGSWINEYRSENTYVSNNIQEGKSYFWNGSSWDLNSKEESQFDTSISTQNLYLPGGASLNNHKIVGSQSYFYNNGLWGYIDSTLYFYSDVHPNTIAHTPTPSYYQIIQNPVNTHLQIKNGKSKNSTISLFSSTGKLIMKAQSTETVIQLDVQYVPNGIYFVAVTNEDEYQVLNVVISH